MFKPVKTQKLDDNLYVIKEGIVNFYVYSILNSLIVFDTGISKEIGAAQFKKLNLDYNKVSNVFLTHSDFDHVGGLNLFKNATIYLSKKEEPMITGKKARRLFVYNKAIEKYNLMDDLQTINIDNTNIQMISTPGHTIGSAMYIINNDILITGDTISLSSTGEIKSFGSFQNMNNKENVETVNKLKKDNFFDKMKIIATGHYGILKKD